MLKILQFGFYVIRMFRQYEAAERAKKSGNDERAFQLLREAREAGCAALDIKSVFISSRFRTVVKKNLATVHGLYQHEVIVRMPEADLELVVSAMKHMKRWADMNIASNISQTEAVIRMFEIAKSRLDADVDDLRMLYWGPGPLYNLG